MNATNIILCLEFADVMLIRNKMLSYRRETALQVAL